VRLQDSIEQLFTDNPDLDKVEAIKKLKEMKDTQTNRPMWKTATIRSAVGTYFNKKKDSAMHIKAPAESIESRSNSEMERHSPKDPFAIKPDGNVEEKVGQIKNKIPTIDTEQFRKKIVDDVSKKVLEQVSTDAKPFRDEILTIVSDFVSEVRKEFTKDRKEISDLKKEVSNIGTQGNPTYEPVIIYNDLKLRRSIIDIIQKNTEDRELGEASEYIDILIANYYEPIVKNGNYYESTVEYDDLNLKQSTIDVIQRNTEEKELEEESEYLDNLIKNEEKYTLKVLKIPS